MITCCSLIELLIGIPVDR